jgi:membrane peptidoglycan carboxypeptidase
MAAEVDPLSGSALPRDAAPREGVSPAPARGLARPISTLLVLLLCPALAFAVSVVAQAYRDAPRLVAGLERAGRLAVDPARLPDGYLDALLAVEDPRFHQHPGIDPVTSGAGSATITQALDDQLLLDSGRQGARRFSKARQLLMALAFDARVSKRDQLRIFVNCVYLGSPAGGPVKGFRQAARVYFDKDWTALTRPEFLALVAMIVAPDELDPARHPRENEQRVRRIERLLAGECRPASVWDVYYRRCL